jgi:enamine deaminase RidA (YjgF/YER057c/UK114 family)
MTVKRIESKDWYSTASIHGDTVYLSGQIAQDTSQNVEGQSRQVFAEIDRVLAACGSHKSKVLMVNVYLKDMSTFEQMNKVWLEWADPDSKPCRATVEAGLALDFGIEVTLTAAI